MGRVLSIDIGSTWTKGALFDLEAPAVVRQAQTPTTQEDLSHGFTTVACMLLGIEPVVPVEKIPTDIPLHVSSSAKGGLSIAAIGIVPDLTVSAAKLAAASAGGRIASHFSYKLTEENVAALEAQHPDIVLLCGGTDGGNESYVLRNAAALAGSRLECAILYAGNAALASEVKRCLAGKQLRVAANLMPEVGTLDIEPARAAIRAIFLEHIVEGRGLARVRALCAVNPKPTPLAVYELLEAWAAEARGGAAAGAAAARWTDTLLIDMGGATTDVYSHCAAFHGEEGTVLRGLEEPVLKRSVEGDLGLRVSAAAAAETGAGYIRRRLAACAARTGAAGAAQAGALMNLDGFQSWTWRAAAAPEVIAAGADERLFDDVLAEACLYHALLRHAGTVEEVWTPAGKVRVQRGKDLRSVKRIVASGGWLARRGSAAPLLTALEAACRDSGGASLLPRQPVVFADSRYILPLLGNIAAHHRAAAVRLAESCLMENANA
jgi:uncharacterized protein (TIGR01319 family)